MECDITSNEIITNYDRRWQGNVCQYSTKTRSSSEISNIEVRRTSSSDPSCVKSIVKFKKPANATVTQLKPVGTSQKELQPIFEYKR